MEMCVRPQWRVCHEPLGYGAAMVESAVELDEEGLKGALRGEG